MFGLQRDEQSAIAGATYLVLRIFFLLARSVWWYIADVRRIIIPRIWVPVLTGIAVAVMTDSLLSIATGWPLRGAFVVAYLAAALMGFFLGIAFDFVLHIRFWRLSDWLMSLRVPRYREQLLYGDESARLKAALQLTTLGQYARPARPELLAAFKDESAEVRAAAATAVLHAIPEPADDDPEPPKAARLLLHDPALPVRVYGAAILIAYNSPPAEFLAVLCDGLKCPDVNVSGLASRGIGKIGPPAEAAIPSLRESLFMIEEPNHEAIDALSKIGAPAIPVLIEVLERGDSTGKWMAARALGDMGEPARVALPALRKVANQPEDFAATAAKKAVEKLGGDIK